MVLCAVILVILVIQEYFFLMNLLLDIQEGDNVPVPVFALHMFL